MSLISRFLTKKDNFSDASVNTESGKDVKTDYQNQVDEAVKALNKGRISKFKKIAASTGESIMRDEKVHAACVDFLSDALGINGSAKKALKFCEVVSAIYPEDERKAAVVGLMQDAVDYISVMLFTTGFSFSKDLYRIYKGNIDRMKDANELFKGITFEKEEIVRPDVKITVLGQINEDIFIESYPNEDEDISRSQFLIFKEIMMLKDQKNHSEDLVFLEGLTRDLCPQLLKEDHYVKECSDKAKELFPEGCVPDLFDELTPDQKELLKSYGGVRTAYFLGLIDEVHRALSFEEDMSIHRKIHNLSDGNLRRGNFERKDASLIDLQREKILEREIAKVTSRSVNEGKGVIIVAGIRTSHIIQTRLSNNNPTVMIGKFREYK